MNRSESPLPIPGLHWGSYPQRTDREADAPRRGLAGRAPDWAARTRRIQARARSWQALDAAALGQQRRRIQARFARDGMTPAAIDAAAACVVEVARRTVNRAAFDGQVAAAIAMTDNRLVEMATGEGKSLATALAAAISALAGMPVHVLTANDYLVARDAATFAPLFEALGLAVATVLAETAAPARRAAYAGPIVYATAREVAFDYLRDRLGDAGCGVDAVLVERLRRDADATPAPVLRGLCAALLDEADSILIDEAQMPLVLSREQADPAVRAALYQAWLLSARLEAGRDFVVLDDDRVAVLEASGRERLEQLAAPLAAAWRNRAHREQRVLSALTARHALRRDRDYLVTTPAPGADPRAARPRIELIDRVTGRIAVGRRWSAGVHGLVAIKEGFEPEPDLETVDRITFQAFFRRYHRLGGSSGTVAEARAELRRVYGLAVVKVASRLPLRRTRGPTRWFASDEARDAAVVERVRALTRLGRPVLIGTDAVIDSRRLAAALEAAGLAPAVLDARFDADEAALIARAGEPGAITVSTHMAGRGTDIPLAPAARAAGGLHVLLCQHNDSRRHDRQLAGRAGRQGDPGSSECWLSLGAAGADRAGAASAPHPAAALLRPWVVGDEVRLPSVVLDRLQWTSQRLLEERARRRRARMLSEDGALRQSLAFTGRD